MGRTQANGLLLLAALFWGSGNVAQKTILEDIGPFTAVGMRCLIAALVLAPFFARASSSPVANTTKSKIKCAAMVIATFAAAVTLYQFGAGLTTVTNAGFLVNTSMVLIPVVSWLLLRQAPGVFIWPAAGLTLLGVYFMSGEALTRFNPGDALALASAGFYSLWMISLGHFVKRHGQAGMITLVQFFATSIFCLPVGFAFEPISYSALQSVLPELLLLGVVSTGLGYLLQAIAQGYTSASEAAVIVSGEAIFGALFAFVLLGESLDAFGLFGAALILAGIATVQLCHLIPISKLSFRGDHP